MLLFLLALCCFLLTLGSAWSSLVFGLTAVDGVVISADSTLAPQGITMVDDFDWVRTIGKCAIGYHCHPTYCEMLHDFLSGQNKLQELSTGHPLTVHSLAGIARRIIMRNRGIGNMIIAGWDSKEQCSVLYWIDEVGSLKKLPYAAHGEEMPLLFSTLDRENQRYHAAFDHGLADGTILEACKLVDACWETVQTRSTSLLKKRRTLGVDCNGVFEIDS